MGIKRSLLSLLFIAILVVQLGFSVLLTTGKVSAEPFSSDNPLETEYIQWRAAQTIVYCLKDEGITLSTNGSEKDIIDRMFVGSESWLPATPHRADNPGDVFRNALGINQNSIECGKPNDMMPIFEALGFSNARDFVSTIDSTAQNKNIPLPSEITGGSIRIILGLVMKDKKLEGDYANLSEGARFWYWNEVFRNNNMCGGVRSKTDNVSGVKVSGSGPFYFYKESSDGRSIEKDDYTYAYIKDGLTDWSLTGKVDFAMTSNGAGNKTSWTFSCESVIGEMTEARRNDFIARMSAYLIANPGASAGSFVNANTSTPDPTCESRMPLSAGWFVCNALDFIGNVLDEFINIVDGMLDIDSQKLQNNDALRSSWSYFRAIATFLLLAVGLIMVIGQAIGGGR